MIVALDPSQELFEHQHGPACSDEYAELIERTADDDGVSPEDIARLDELDRQQSELEDKFLSVWTKLAEASASKRGLDLYVNLGGTEESDNADAFRKEVSALAFAALTA